MDLNEFAKEVHANAVAHGWWETERDPAEIIALIHSEWSEALEISIHAPAWGATHAPQHRKRRIRISTHAPYQGGHLLPNGMCGI